MIYLSSIESLYKHIQKIGLLSCIQSCLILIGGCSRSGKSIIASRLSQNFTANGIDNPIVAIDSWLISLENRKPDSTVLGRYDCETIIKSIKEILSGNIVYPPVYDINSRRRIAQQSKDPIFAKSGIIIVEGVIALALKELLDIAVLRIFVTVSDKIRLARLTDFYHKTKGLSIKQTKDVIFSREAEEVPFIKKTAEYADVIFKT